MISWINGGTIPPDIIVTSDRPDIVLVDREKKELILAELTCPFEPYIDSANARKTEKYSSLKSDIDLSGYKCQLICFEIGSRGLVTRNNKKKLAEITRFAKNGGKMKMKCHYQQISKLAVLTSYSIYNARREPEWFSPVLLKP